MSAGAVFLGNDFRLIGNTFCLYPLLKALLNSTVRYSRFHWPKG